MSETKRYRLRSIQHVNGQEKEDGIVLETTAKLKDWLIVTYDDRKHPPATVSAVRRLLREKWGEKVLVLPKDFEFFVFEEMEEEPPASRSSLSQLPFPILLTILSGMITTHEREKRRKDVSVLAPYVADAMEELIVDMLVYDVKAEKPVAVYAVVAPPDKPEDVDRALAMIEKAQNHEWLKDAEMVILAPASLNLGDSPAYRIETYDG